MGVWSTVAVTPNYRPGAPARSTDEVDFLVVGSGSGLDVASVAVNQGQSVAVVETGPLGGTCLNRGCIPSKMLLYHADVLATVERADEFHVDARVEDVDFSTIVQEVTQEVAGVGAREQDPLESGDAYATRTDDFRDTARGDAMKADGTLKAIIHPDGEILGCHIVGPEASTLIQEVVVAMTAGSGTVRDIRDAVHVHPALSEVVQRGFSGQFTRGDYGDHGHDHGHGDGDGDHDHGGTEGHGHDHAD